MVRKHFLRKWLKSSSLQDFDIRTVSADFCTLRSLGGGVDSTASLTRVIVLSESPPSMSSSLYTVGEEVVPLKDKTRKTSAGQHLDSGAGFLCWLSQLLTVILGDLSLSILPQFPSL